MTSVTSLVAANQSRWDGVSVTRSGFNAVASKIVKSKARYQKIEAATGVPWFIIGVIHEREASGDFNCQLAQGDPLNEVSVHEPRGRGPFYNHPTDPPGEDAFYRGALDALCDCAPYASNWKDWSPGGAMTLLEEYNGLGYYDHGKPSPYIWAGTDQYTSGKYVADGMYDPNTVDKQLGCAGLILAMMEIDSSIAFGAPAHPDTHTLNEHPAAPASIRHNTKKPKSSKGKKAAAVVAGAGAAVAAAHGLGLSTYAIIAIVVFGAVVAGGLVLSKINTQSPAPSPAPAPAPAPAPTPPAQAPAAPAPTPAPDVTRAMTPPTPPKK